MLRKQPITPRGTSEVFRTAPLLLVATTVAGGGRGRAVRDHRLALARGGADLFAVVALLALGTVALALAGLDTGTAFGGMGASREITILALVEPTLLVAVFALSVPVGSTNLAAIVTRPCTTRARVSPRPACSPRVALGRGVVAETGRLPVDNPSTHLELTMVHEAMVLEYAGPDLALVELASAMRLTRVPRAAGQPVRALGHRGRRWRRCARRSATLAFVVKVAVLGAALAAGEVFLAKLRLFRVPELLAGIVRPGAARRGRVVLLRLNPLPRHRSAHDSAWASDTPMSELRANQCCSALRSVRASEGVR